MLKDTGRVQENNLLEMRSFFYHREHLVIVTELLRQNLHEDTSDEDDDEKKMFHVYQPKMTSVAARLGFDEDFMDQPRLSEEDEKRAQFVDFVSKLLTIDPDARLSAAEALNHPWITSSLDLTEDDIIYGQ